MSEISSSTSTHHYMMNTYSRNINQEQPQTRITERVVYHQRSSPTHPDLVTSKSAAYLNMGHGSTIYQVDIFV